MNFFKPSCFHFENVVCNYRMLFKLFILFAGLPRIKEWRVTSRVQWCAWQIQHSCFWYGMVQKLFGKVSWALNLIVHNVDDSSFFDWLQAIRHQCHEMWDEHSPKNLFMFILVLCISLFAMQIIIQLGMMRILSLFCKKSQN